jgi:D-alanyl-lipoteichoic acid acyltransferase DltB (MBOAT superfamily)
MAWTPFVLIALALVGACAQRAVAPGRRWAVLLAFSYAFYALLASPWLLAVLWVCSLWIYRAGPYVFKRRLSEGRATALGMALSPLLVLLLFIKLESGWIAWLGVSYFLFAAVSYLADIYLGDAQPEPDFGLLALYLAFFPKLVQGPVERAGAFLGQAREGRIADPATLGAAARLFAWGLFKKAVIADRLAPFVASIYDAKVLPQGPGLVWGTALFAAQLFADFSGYTDMARGVAGLLGIDLVENFDAPFAATSTTDFWRRWHISFSNWIRDYVFQPLQMALRNWGTYGTIAALFATYILVALWHDHRRAYLYWGLMEAWCMAWYVLWRPWQKKLHRALGLERTRVLRLWQISVTLALTLFSLIFFRAANLPQARALVRGLAIGWSLDGQAWKALALGGQEPLELGLAVAGVALMVLGWAWRERWRPIRSGALRYALDFGLLTGILLFGRFFAAKQFIYAQF